MLTLYHAPYSRASRIVTLIDELGIKDRINIVPVTIQRQDGTGAPDAGNPHPEGKVPLLVHDGVMIRESGAIIQYLTDIFPDAGLGRPVGHPQRGDYIGWLFWYGAVMEPVLIFDVLKIDHPGLPRTFRGHAEVIARLHTALAKGPYLLGDAYSAVDLLVQSPYAWFTQMLPDDPVIQAWVARCAARPSVARTFASDAALMAGQAAAAA